MKRAYLQGFMPVEKRGRKMPQPHLARDGAAGLVAMGPKAVSVMPELRRIIEKEKPPLTSFARVAVTAITGRIDDHLSALRADLEYTSIRDQSKAYGVWLPPTHAVRAAALLKKKGAELIPALESLCFHPGLDRRDRTEALRALCIIDGGGERSTALLSRIFECPLIFYDYWSPGLLLIVLKECGVPYPKLVPKVRELTASGGFRTRRRARRLLAE
jgi:hypothetical protein